MRNLIIGITILSGLILISAFQTRAIEQVDDQEISLIIDFNMTKDDSTGYYLFQNNCNSCHSTVGKTHDQLIAPPMRGVKNHYLRDANNRDEFIENIVAWAQNPTEDKAKMIGAVQKFSTMPHINFRSEDLEKIAGYIYDSEMERPAWAGKYYGNLKQGKMYQGHGVGKMNGKSNTKAACGGNCGSNCKGSCGGSCKGKGKGKERPNKY